MDNLLQIRLKSINENIALSRNIMGVLVLSHNPTMSFVNELKTIVSEAVTNAIIHGYGGKDCFEVVLDIELNDTEIKVGITDYGIGIENIEEAKVPMFTTKKEDDRSGLGFTIMEIFSDTFSVKSDVGKGTCISITKKWQ